MHRELDPTKDIISVHQMGKVGSTSVYHTLQEALPGYHIFHTHQYHAETILKVMRKAITDDHRIPPHLHDSLKFRYWVQVATRAIARGAEKRAPQVHIISMVRDPVARNMSALFENIGRWLKR